MRPCLEPGRRALIRTGIDPARLRVGDVAAVPVGRGGALALHRIRSISRGRVTAQGDACARPDPPVDAARVHGRMAAYEAADGSWRVPDGRTAAWMARLLAIPRPRLRRLAQRAVLALAPRDRRAPGDWIPAAPPPGECEPDWEWEEIGAEIAFHDRRSGTVHVLNETAAEVWRGSRAGEAEKTIAARLARQYLDAPASLIEGDVRRIVEGFRRCKLPMHEAAAPGRRDQRD